MSLYACYDFDYNLYLSVSFQGSARDLDACPLVPHAYARVSAFNLYLRIENKVEGSNSRPEDQGRAIYGNKIVGYTLYCIYVQVIGSSNLTASDERSMKKEKRPISLCLYGNERQWNEVSSSQSQCKGILKI